MYKIDTPHISEYPIILNVWESSVRATHHFLKESDIQFFKNLIREKEILDQVNLSCARGSDNEILGFMGIAGEKLEMLFIDSMYRGKGIGKLLLLHAIKTLKIKKLDVNEQNEQAIEFYRHFGFEVISRSELDGLGMPYPILHMQLP